MFPQHGAHMSAARMEATPWTVVGRGLFCLPPTPSISYLCHRLSGPSVTAPRLALAGPGTEPLLLHTADLTTRIARTICNTAVSASPDSRTVCSSGEHPFEFGLADVRSVGMPTATSPELHARLRCPLPQPLSPPHLLRTLAISQVWHRPEMQRPMPRRLEPCGGQRRRQRLQYWLPCRPLSTTTQQPYPYFGEQCSSGSKVLCKLCGRKECNGCTYSW